MKLVPLSDVISGSVGLTSPSTLGRPSFRYVDIASVDNQSKRITEARSILVSEAPSRARKMIRANDVIVSMTRPNLNAVARVPDELDGEICSTGFCVLRPSAAVNSEYLFYFVRSAGLIASLSNKVGGAMYPAVMERQVLEEKIPLPKPDEQRRIVDILARAEGIVRLRYEAQRKAAELIPALFLDMFGDPATNPKGWPVARLGDVAEKMSDGPFGSNLKTSHYTEEGVRVIRLQNIGVGYLNDADKAFVSPEHFATLPRHRCLPGDVIIGTLGDPNLRSIVLPPSIPEALNKADCVQFRCRKEEVSPEYVCWLMNTPSTLVMAASLVQGITRTRISMGRLRELFVPVPPLAAQQDFADRVEQIRVVQAQQVTATEQATASFDALLAQSFVEG